MDYPELVALWTVTSGLELSTRGDHCALTARNLEEYDKLTTSAESLCIATLYKPFPAPGVKMKQQRKYLPPPAGHFQLFNFLLSRGAPGCLVFFTIWGHMGCRKSLPYATCMQQLAGMFRRSSRHRNSTKHSMSNMRQNLADHPNVHKCTFRGQLHCTPNGPGAKPPKSNRALQSIPYPQTHSADGSAHIKHTQPS